MPDGIRLDGWRPGLQKVALAQLIRRYSGSDLKQVQTAVDQLLDYDAIEFHVREGDPAEVLRAAEALGATGSVIRVGEAGDRQTRG